MITDADVIIVGAGHAGCEAAAAACRMGGRAVLITLDLVKIAEASCNPAIGGLGKGHIVKEVDALGGLMGVVTDRSGLQFRTLNRRKGPAVQATRVQIDKARYSLEMRLQLDAMPNLTVIQDRVDVILSDDGKITGVKTQIGTEYHSGAVVLTTGTFMRGLMHIGMTQIPGGRLGDLPVEEISRSLESLGLELRRLKTGTPPRVDIRSIDLSKLDVQHGDSPMRPFSFGTALPDFEQSPCYLTYSNARTHEIIRNALSQSPLFTGKIQGTGPRYCPSIEDKVVRFPERDRHQVFLEPEIQGINGYYLNGLSTSLPYDVQEAYVRSIPGFEKAELLKPGYAVEYDFAPTRQIDDALAVKGVPGLFLAGQINGTSGYEEAAGQGLLAGVNALRFVRGDRPVRFQRDEAYIGVMIDDLVTRTITEPYRMFTSRAEHRLKLREGNADLRLAESARRLGLIDKERYDRICRRSERIEREIHRMEQTSATAPDRPGAEPVPLKKILSRPEWSYSELMQRLGKENMLDESDAEEVNARIKYAGYIERHERSLAKVLQFENTIIPDCVNYGAIQGLRTEAAQRLAECRPRTLGQASRLEGVTYAAISALLVYLHGKNLI